MNLVSTASYKGFSGILVWMTELKDQEQGKGIMFGKTVFVYSNDKHVAVHLLAIYVIVEK